MRTAKLLTEHKCRTAKAAAKDYTLHDPFGLYLFVRVSGLKTWRLRYISPVDGQIRRLTLGRYISPAGGLNLNQARHKAQEARRLIELGTDPMIPTAKSEPEPKILFRDIWEKYRQSRIIGADPKRLNYIKDCTGKVANHVLPFIGDRPADEITSIEVKQILDTLEARGRHETLKKVKIIIGQILDYAGAELNLPDDAPNPAKSARLARRYETRQVKHRPCCRTNIDIARLMKGITSYQSKSAITSLALRMLILTFVRPDNVVKAKWSEIDYEKGWWLIPSENMKRVKGLEYEHSVPLSRQMLALLKELKPMTGFNPILKPYLFPSEWMTSKTGYRPTDTLRRALQRIGFNTSTEMCPHGARGMATTVLNEFNWPDTWIEKQMAHVQRNKVKGAYDHSENFDGRRLMVQWYADFLEALEFDQPIPPKPSF